MAKRGQAVRRRVFSHIADYDSHFYRCANTCWVRRNLLSPAKLKLEFNVQPFTKLTSAFEYGIPTVWVDVDEDDPCVFESQASYLKRHGLFLTGEEKRRDFEPETVSSGCSL